MTTDDLRASVRFDHQLLAVEREHRVHCMLELTAPKAPATERRPLHRALVIDRSGSMAGDKLEATKACAAYLARRLEPTDRPAVTTYDDEVRRRRCRGSAARSSGYRPRVWSTDVVSQTSGTELSPSSWPADSRCHRR